MGTGTPHARRTQSRRERRSRTRPPGRGRHAFPEWAWAAGCLLSGCATDPPADGLNLTACSEALAPAEGALLLLEELGPPVLSAVELGTGARSLVFAVPSGGFAYEFDAGAEGVVLAYTAPAVQGEVGYDRSVLVLLVDGAMRPLGEQGAPGRWSFFPTWSADDAAVWFVATGEGTKAPSVLSRLDLATQTSVGVVPFATEPAVSEDGAHLAWVALDPVTTERTLVVGDASGGAARVVVSPATAGDLGRPFFSTDSQWLYFTVLAEVAPPTTALLDLFVPSAHAHANHDREGDWWRVPVEGGDPERVSFLDTIHYDGAPGVDGAILTATRDGVLRIDPELGEVETLRCLRTVRAVGRMAAVPTEVR